MNAAVLAVGDVDDAVAIDLNRMRQTELSGAGAGFAPFANAFALAGVLEDARVAIAVGDKDAAVRREGNVGGAAETVAWRGLSADFDLQQLLPLRRELVDHRAGRVRRPDVALRIDADGMRRGVHAFAPRSHHFAIAIDNDYGIGVVAAL